MHRIDTSNAVANLFGPGKSGFGPGDPATNTPATFVDKDFFNALQEELAAIPEAAGIALSKATRNQVLTALLAMFGAKGLAARAVVNFNGFTGAVQYAQNVTSITKISAGIYEINFTTPMSDALYAWVGSAGENNGITVSASNPGGNNIIAGNGGAVGLPTVKTTTKLRVYCHQPANTSSPEGSQEDATSISVIVFGA